MENENTLNKKSIKKSFTGANISRKGTDDFGKLPPQVLQLEEAVLGAIMLERNALTEVIEVLQPEMFYLDANQRIYQAIRILFADNEPVDSLTVVNKLKTTGELDMVGGPAYIGALTLNVSSSANTEYHARIIIEKFIQRRLIEISSGVIKDAYEDTTDVLDLLDKAQNELFNLIESNFRRGTKSMTEIARNALKEIENARNNTTGINGVPTGFTELDKITGGWQKSDLLILAARPGMGKTAFALNMLRNIAVDYKRPVAFFSLEMSDVQLFTRLLSAELEIPGDDLRRGKLSEDEFTVLSEKITGLSEAPIYIDDTAGLSLFELRAKCRRLKTQHDIQFVAVDYLQLMTGSGDKDRGFNREQQISMISRGLKALAKELEIPILALSQLSRDVEKRGGDKKPQLSDLRESGAIEQDADIVMFIYRQDYYDKDNPTTEGIAELDVAKHRNGKTGSIPLNFISKFAKFTNANLDFTTFGGSDFDNGDYGNNFSGAKIQTFPSKMNDDTGDDEYSEYPF